MRSRHCFSRSCLSQWRPPHRRGRHAAAIDRAGGIVLGWHERGLLDERKAARKHFRRLKKAHSFWHGRAADGQ